MSIKKLLAVIMILTILSVGAFFGIKYLMPSDLDTNLATYNAVSDLFESDENDTLDSFLQSSEQSFNATEPDTKNNYTNAKYILRYIQSVGVVLNSFCMVADVIPEIEYVTISAFVENCEDIRGDLIRELVLFKAMIKDGPTELANTYNRIFGKIAQYVIKNTELVGKINNLSKNYYYQNSLSFMNSLYEMEMLALNNTYVLTNYQINSVAYNSFDALQVDFNMSNGYVDFDSSILEIGGMSSEPVQKFLEKYETIDKSTFVINYQILKTTTPSILDECESDFEIAMFYLGQIMGGI